MPHGCFGNYGKRESPRELYRFLPHMFLYYFPDPSLDVALSFCVLDITDEFTRSELCSGSNLRSQLDSGFDPVRQAVFEEIDQYGVLQYFRPLFCKKGVDCTLVVDNRVQGQTKIQIHRMVRNNFNQLTKTLFFRKCFVFCAESKTNVWRIYKTNISLVIILSYIQKKEGNTETHFLHFQMTHLRVFPH